MTFYGTFEHSVDERGRIAIPARYRNQLADGAVVRPGPDGCLEMYSKSGFEAETELRLGEERSTRGLAGRRIRRAFLPDAFDLELDRQGRVLMPQQLRAHASLEDRAIIIGLGDYIEIWHPQRWTAEHASARSQGAAGVPS